MENSNHDGFLLWSLFPPPPSFLYMFTILLSWIGWVDGIAPVICGGWIDAVHVRFPSPNL